MYIPERTKVQIDEYVQTGCPVGGFLEAVLSNNLMEAFARADEENCASMFGIVHYLYNKVPLDCWGSPENYKAWIKKGGLKGRSEC